MKRLLFLLLAAAILCSFSLPNQVFYGQVSTATIGCQGTETWCEDWDGCTPWSCDNTWTEDTTGYDIEADAGPEGSGDDVMQADGTNDDLSITGIGYTGTGPIKIWFYVDSSDSNDDMRIYLKDSESANNTILTVTEDSGNIKIRYYDGSYNDIVTGLSLDTWYYIQIDDITWSTDDTMDIGVYNASDVLQGSVANDVNFWNDTANDNFDGIGFYPAAGQSFDHRYDMISMD